MNVKFSRLKPILLGVFLFMFFLLFVYHMDATKHVNALSINFLADKVDFTEMCLTPKNITQSNLDAFLKARFTTPTLNYSQYSNGKALPENENLEASCFKNLRIYTSMFSWNTVNLTEHTRNVKNNFLEKYANPPIKACKEKRCVIKPYSKDEERPDPSILIENKEKTIDEDKVANELKRLEAFGRENGDDDLTNIPEVVKILEKNLLKVPNIVHFVSFSCHEYKISAYLTMLAALKHQKPDLIVLHTDCEPTGWYWHLFKSAAGETLKIVKKTPPKSIFGRAVGGVEHQSDVARLHVLLQVGGIYLDSDSVVMRSMDGLRGRDIVLGEESLISLANGIILASKDSWFLRRWFQEYQNFNDGDWGISSVQTPRALWQLFPDRIHVVEMLMARPNWLEYQMLHRGFFDWSKHYTVHLTTRFFDEYDKKRTLSQFAVLNTSYGEVARKVLWGDASFRGVQNEVLNPLNW